MSITEQADLIEQALAAVEKDAVPDFTLFQKKVQRLRADLDALEQRVNSL